MKKSIVRNYLVLSLIFGVIMGIVFPFYSILFVNFKSRVSGIFFVCGCILAGIVVGLSCFLIGKITIIHQIKIISKNLNRNSSEKGTLSKHLKLESDDIIGEMISNYNIFTDSLNDLFVKIQYEMQTHLGQTEIMAEQSFKLLNSSESLDSKNRHLIEYAKEIESLSLKNSTLSLELSKTAAKNVVNIEEGTKALQMTVEKISSIQNELSAINEIGKSINMIALNASIEASRAGKYGKGFAVVAVEIRKLANQTLKVAGSITDIATEIFSHSQSTVNKMDKVVPEIKKIETTADIMNETTKLEADAVNAILLLNQSYEQTSRNLSENSEKLNLLADKMKEEFKKLTLKVQK